MAKLQIIKIPGFFGETVRISNGPPAAAKIIEASESGTVFGEDQKSAFCELTPIGGPVAITWPGGIVELLRAKTLRKLRGEVVSVSDANTGTPAPAVYVIPILGQSNAAGRDARVSDDDDLTGYPNISQYSCKVGSANYQTLVHQFPLEFNESAFATTLSPAESFAKALYDTGAIAAEAKVILVPLAIGATGLTAGGGGSWLSSGTPGAGGALWQNAVTKTNAAIVAAQAANPGAPIVVRPLWCQGENDSTQTFAQYQTDFTNLITNFRTLVTGASTAAFTVLSTPPERWLYPSTSNYSAGLAGIMDAQINISKTVTGVWFVRGADPRIDGPHYTSASQRTNGQRCAATWIDTATPTVTTAITQSNTESTPLAIAMTGSETWQTFEIAGGADAAKFEFTDPYTGWELRWAGNDVKDFDAPDDAGGNNVYDVSIRARDGKGNVGAPVSITVTVTAANSAPPPDLLWIDPSDVSSLKTSNAGTGTVTNGLAVGHVADKSIHSFHYSSVADDGSRPVYKTDGTYHWLEADGVDDHLRRVADLGIRPGVASTQFIAFRASPNAGQRIFGQHNNTNVRLIYDPLVKVPGIIDAGVQVRGLNTTTIVPPSSPATTPGALDGSYHVIGVEDNGSNHLRVWLNKVLLFDGNYTFSDTFTANISTLFSANMNGVLSGFYRGRLYGLRVHSGVLLDATREAVFDEMAAKMPEVGSNVTPDLFWLSASDLTTMFKSNAGGENVAADGDPVGKWNDKSTAAFHFTSEADDTTRPTYGTDGTQKWVAWDGVNDLLLRMAAAGLGPTDRFTIIMACRANPAASARFLALTNPSNNKTEFSVMAANTTAPTSAAMVVRNDSATTSQIGPDVVTLASVWDNTDRVISIESNGIGDLRFWDGTTLLGSYTWGTATGTLTFSATTLGGIKKLGILSSFFAMPRLYELRGYGSVLDAKDRAAIQTAMAEAFA